MTARSPATFCGRSRAEPTQGPAAAPDISDVYYLALLYHIGCTGAVAAQSRLGGGDDINVRRWMSEVDYTDRPEMMRVAATKIAPRWGATGWPQGIAGLASAERDL